MCYSNFVFLFLSWFHITQSLNFNVSSCGKGHFKQRNRFIWCLPQNISRLFECFFFYPNCCSVQTWSWMSRPRLFTRLLSELGLLSELILSVMTSDRHHFILHYPIDATATKAALLSLPALNHWLAGTIPCDVYRTITLPEEHLTVSQRFMQLLKPWQCKLRQIDRQEVTIITKWVKKNNKVQFIINMTHNVT